MFMLYAHHFFLLCRWSRNTFAVIWSWNLRFSNYRTFPLILQVCLVQDPSLNPNPTHIHELEIAIAIGSCKNWTIALGKKIWNRCPFVISHISNVSSYQCCMPLSVYNFLWWSVDLISSLFTSCSSVDESVDVVILSPDYIDCRLSCKHCRFCSVLHS